MFFATPHLGLGSEIWPHFTKHVLQLDAPDENKTTRPTSSMLHELELNNDSLYRLTEDFQSLRDSLAFVTFVEQDILIQFGLPKKASDPHTPR